MELRPILPVNILFLDLGSLIRERLYPMKLKQKPQSGPDSHLIIQIEPLLHKLIQGFSVNPRQCHAETALRGFVRQFGSLELYT